MSESDVELVRAIYDRFLSGDAKGGLALIHPDFVAYDRPEIPDPQVFRGHQGIFDALGTSFADFDSVDIVPEEFVDAGDRVVVVFRFQGIGRESGVPIDERLCHVWTVRDGSAVRMEVRSGRP
jgi:ketosteroid isomerase-like protein